MDKHNPQEQVNEYLKHLSDVYDFTVKQTNKRPSMPVFLPSDMANSQSKQFPLKDHDSESCESEDLDDDSDISTALTQMTKFQRMSVQSKTTKEVLDQMIFVTTKNKVGS